MSHWPETFVYRITPGPGVFMLAVFISVLTVGYRSLKAALANPVKSLRLD